MPDGPNALCAAPASMLPAPKGGSRGSAGSPWDSSRNGGYFEHPSLRSAPSPAAVHLMGPIACHPLGFERFLG